MPGAKPIPDGYASLTPYLIVDGAAAAIAFYKAVFGARERMRMDGAGGRIGHAELDLSGSVVMLADEAPQIGARSPKAYGGSPVSLLLYVDKVDEVVARAVASGAKVTRPVADQFYGDRLGVIEDPFGHIWSIATHIEDVAPEELQRRAAQARKGG
jgi:PhnB protein